MTIKKNSDCIGVILSGGLSSRMGTDKALLNRNAETMLSYSLKQLQNTNVTDVLVSGKQHGIADSFEQLGPMGGIFTIIEKYQPKALLISPVDLPFIDSQTLQHLKTIGELTAKPCFYQDNYLPLYLPVTAFVEQFFKQTFLPFLQNNKSCKGPSIRALLAQTPHKAIPLKNKQFLLNTNTPEQWLQAKKVLSSPFLYQQKNHGNPHV